MLIGNHDIAKKVFIVAEIGNNHEGDEAMAVDMIHVAASCGADAVKFQCIDPEHLGDTPERKAQLKRICLPWEAFPRLHEYAMRCGVQFLCTPFNVAAVDFLDPYVPAWKIAGRDCDNWRLYGAAVATGKPMIVSCPAGKEVMVRSNLTVLMHVVSEYPTPPERANLTRALMLPSPHGYSCHVSGIEACVGAVYMGARVIEKHFTLDHNQSDFRDHQHAADPEELSEMVDRIRMAEVLCSNAG